MPVIPPHTCKKEKKMLPVNSDGVIIGDENNSSEAVVEKADSSIWWYVACI